MNSDSKNNNSFDEDFLNTGWTKELLKVALESLRKTKERESKNISQEKLDFLVSLDDAYNYVVGIKKNKEKVNEIKSVTIDTLLNNVKDEKLRSKYKFFKDGEEILTNAALLDGASDIKTWARRGKMTINDFGGILRDTIEKETIKIIDNAKEVEPFITQDMKKLENDKMFLIGEDNKFKSSERIQEKIIKKARERGKDVTVQKILDASLDVKDSLRYTFILDLDSYVEDMENTLNILENEGYEVIKFKNNWEIGANYVGVNCSLRKKIDDKYFVLELQFHTRDSFLVKDELTHDIYEVMTSLTISEEYVSLSKKMQKTLSSTIEFPKNIIGYSYDSRNRNFNFPKR